jgi:hypothetical protein
MNPACRAAGFATLGAGLDYELGAEVQHVSRVSRADLEHVGAAGYPAPDISGRSVGTNGKRRLDYSRYGCQANIHNYLQCKIYACGMKTKIR